MSRFTAIDLSELPPVEIVDTPNFEVIYQEMLADAVNRLQAAGIDYNVGSLESDPLAIILQAQAYREMILRARINDSIRAVLLAYSWGTNLDHLGAYLSVVRQEGESDDRFRRRIQLANEAFSTAGPYGAYKYHALTASPDVREVAVMGPESGLVDPGQVGLWVLSRRGTGAADATLLALVDEACSHEDVRPLTDQVLVQPADVETYQVDMTILVPRGPSGEIALAESRRRVSDYVEAQHRMGRSVTRAGLYAAGMAPEVINLTLNEPLADIEPGPTSAAYCTAAVVNMQVQE